MSLITFGIVLGYLNLSFFNLGLKISEAFLIPIKELLAIFTLEVNGEMAAPINLIPIPWKNSPLPFQSWYSFINIHETLLSISIMLFLIP